MFSSPSDKVMYHYGVYKPLFDTIEKMPLLSIHRGLPTKVMLQVLANPISCKLVILDDLIDYVTSSAAVESLFVKGVHH